MILLVMLWNGAVGQDTLKKKLEIKGYVKDLQSLTFQQNLTNLVTGNLIHHRLNVRWYPIKNLTGAVEVRNRLFWGEEIAQVPNFSSQLRNANEPVKLTWNPIDQKRMVFNTTIDRLWLEYGQKKWNLRVGRQRVNWGIGTTWNPNDLFNTFNFLDFDYEERPGIDGMKFQYLTGDMDFVETSVSFGRRAEDFVAAVRYFKNIANYDLQFLAGVYRTQPTLGVGWSGSIKETGFKGEFQYFVRDRNTEGQLNASMEADHVFSKGWYINIGAFLNSLGATTAEGVSQISNLQFSPQHLMPTKWNSSLTVSKELSPLMVVNTTIIYSPNTDLMILLPTMTYSATENLDVSIVWQSFFIDQQSTFDDVSHRCFVRFKWSY